MRKKLLALSGVVVLTLTGCSSSNSAVGSPTSVQSQANQITQSAHPTAETMQSQIDVEVSRMQNEIQSEINKIANDNPAQAVTGSLNDVCKYLESKGIVSGTQTAMAGQMIGAISGVKYSAQSIEIYEYDTTSEKYKNLVDTNAVVLDGFNMTLTASAINGKYVMFGGDDNAISVFKDMR